MDEILGTFRLFDEAGNELLAIGPRELLPGDTMSLDGVEVHLGLKMTGDGLTGSETFMDGRIAFTWEVADGVANGTRRDVDG